MEREAYERRGIETRLVLLLVVTEVSLATGVGGYGVVV